VVPRKILRKTGDDTPKYAEIGFQENSDDEIHGESYRKMHQPLPIPQAGCANVPRDGGPKYETKSDDDFREQRCKN